MCIRDRFYSILVVLFAVAIGVTLCMTVFFNIQTIQVQGETRYETEEIIRASGLAKGKNLLLADIKGGEEDLTVKLPYIGSAHIVRKLPATVIIEVEENTPAYAVQDVYKRQELYCRSREGPGCGNDSLRYFIIRHRRRSVTQSAFAL